LHEVVRKHSLAVAEDVSRGEPNTLLERLGSDPAFRGVSTAALQAELEPDNYTGRAAQQVGEFLEDYLLPLLKRARPFAVEAGSAEVKV
ncbi:MAG TPA: adenylosuccinate lyase, partial [Gemmatimonadales bacterium]